MLHWLLTANVAEKVHDVASNLAFHQHIQDIRVAIMGAAGAKDMLWDGGYSDERNINFLGGDVRARIFFHASHAPETNTIVPTAHPAAHYPADLQAHLHVSPTYLPPAYSEGYVTDEGQQVPAAWHHMHATTDTPPGAASEDPLARYRDHTQRVYEPPADQPFVTLAPDAMLHLGYGVDAALTGTSAN